MTKKILFIDFETYSEFDLSYGTFPYSEHPSTDVICMAYAFNEEEVRLWLPGQPLPKDVFDHFMTMGTIRSWNVTFEYNIINNVCHKKYGFPKVSSDQVECTMTDALALSLPASLEACGKALGLDIVKDKIGKLLITQLSKPKKATKKNPSTQLTIESDPEKFNEFYEYCKQDVRAEIAIYKSLTRHLKQSELELFRLTLDINERGIPVDIELTNAILTAKEKYSKDLAKEILTLTEGKLDSTNSRPKSLAWLNDKGVSLKNYTKEDVNFALKKINLLPEVKRFLEIKSELGRTPIKKFDFIKEAVCKDGTVKGNLIFHKASTGRFCLSDDTELLTENGWVNVYECREPIAVWSKNSGEIFFETTKINMWPLDDDLIHIKNKFTDMIITKEHVIPFFTSTEKFMTILAKDMLGRGLNKYILSGEIKKTGEEIQTRVIVMTQADGNFNYNENNKNLRFIFVKKRKIERCRRLLKEAEIEFSETQYSNKVVFYISWENIPKWLSDFEDKDFNIFSFIELDLYAFIDELPKWDGHTYEGQKSFEYSTCSKNNAYFSATVAHLTGNSARVIARERQASWNTNYRVYIRPSKYTRITNNHSKLTKYRGNVFCPETSTGFFLVRRNGLISITGNSGTGFQMQNLPRDTNKNPEELIKKFLSHDTENINVIDRGIELIRSVVKAPLGMRLLVSDFASIENRVLAWVAKDTKTLDDFRNGVDQYKRVASGIYKVPYDQVTKDQRQLGKISVLSCGYGGGAKTFKEICETQWNVFLSEEQAKEIVDSYRSHYPKIVNLWYGLEETAREAVKRNYVTEYNGIRFKVLNDFLMMRLPSGRMLAYYKPIINMVKTPWGENKEAITHFGLRLNQWERINITPGRLTENLVQAVARDFLTEAMMRVENRGYSIIGCIHDEVIALNKIGFGSIEEFNSLLEISPEWALDCPIKAEGFESERYKK